jgi:hypothetical protein
MAKLVVNAATLYSCLRNFKVTLQMDAMISLATKPLLLNEAKEGFLSLELPNVPYKYFA